MRLPRHKDDLIHLKIYNVPRKDDYYLMISLMHVFARSLKKYLFTVDDNGDVPVSLRLSNLFDIVQGHKLNDGFLMG